MYNRPVELCFVGLNDRTLSGSATLCSILNRYIVLYFFTQKETAPAD